MFSVNQHWQEEQQSMIDEPRRRQNERRNKAAFGKWGGSVGMGEIKHSTDLIFFAEEQTEERSEQINTEVSGLQINEASVFMEKQVMPLFFLENSHF